MSQPAPLGIACVNFPQTVNDWTSPYGHYLSSIRTLEAALAEIRKFRITGVRCSCKNCVIARLLILQFPGIRVLVGGEISIWTRTHVWIFQLSDAWYRLRRNFDHGLYPDLVEPELETKLPGIQFPKT